MPLYWTLNSTLWRWVASRLPSDPVQNRIRTSSENDHLFSARIARAMSASIWLVAGRTIWFGSRPKNFDLFECPGGRFHQIRMKRTAHRSRLMPNRLVLASRNFSASSLPATTWKWQNSSTLRLRCWSVLVECKHLRLHFTFSLLIPPLKLSNCTFADTRISSTTCRLLQCSSCF